MTVTVLPPRWAVWRRISTRPRLVFCNGLVIGGASGVAGRFRSLRTANGLGHGGGSLLVGTRSFFFIPSHSLPLDKIVFNAHAPSIPGNGPASQGIVESRCRYPRVRFPAEYSQTQ